MSSVLDIAEPPGLERDQTAFNLAVWERVLADPFYASLPHRIETNAHGQIIMSPPPRPEHGEEQFEIGTLLQTLLPQGKVATECPLSTSGGVKGIDVAWISLERRAAQKGQPAYITAPEICVEVISPSNTKREMQEKKTLYFEAGAEEVWFCSHEGRMSFFTRNSPEKPAASLLCPDFPEAIDIA